MASEASTVDCIEYAWFSPTNCKYVRRGKNGRYR